VIQEHRPRTGEPPVDASRVDVEYRVHYLGFSEYGDAGEIVAVSNNDA
jgi:hypothetical protein